MNLWGRVFAALYDRAMSGSETAVLRGHRKALIPLASGSVLEIGGGTGANLEFYGKRIERLVITEPEQPMAVRLDRKLGSSAQAAEVIGAPAEALPFPDASFDFVVSTLVLCTVGEPARALSEIHRVLKPEGRLLFLEHVRSDDPRLAQWQDRFHGAWVRFGHGCHCNRTTLDTIESAGFSVVELARDTLRTAPPIVQPLIVGVAQVPGAGG